MGRNKWNISKLDGQTLAYSIICDLLINSKDNILEIKELMYLLTNRTKNNTITNNNKKKNIINFIRSNFGGFKDFLKLYDTIDIILDNNIEYVRYINRFENEWTVIDDYNDYYKKND